MSSEYLLSIGAINGNKIILHGELWRLVTAMFLHAGIIHITLNMLSLWFVGQVVESWSNSFLYISIYFISGIFGGLISMYIHYVEVGIGASGAIFGIFGALVGIVIIHRKRIGNQFKYFMQDFGTILLINFIIGVVFKSVDLIAHIAGFVVGMIGGMMVAKSPKLIWIYISVMVLFMILFYSHLYSIYTLLLNAQF